MGDYSIIRDGNEYVVRAGEKSVLKISSRRRAVKLISDAAELLQQKPVLPASEAPSIGCDPEVSPCDPGSTSSDSRVCDLPVGADPTEVP
ncbi:MAG: hypothetical protein ABI561_26900 [Bradyrhizobium sp.]